ncbi:hypothetical protein D9M71_685730 [compost metagenome]
MITILLAGICMTYDASGACTDRQVWPAGMWEGPEAPMDCEAEAMASRRRLHDEGLERHFVIWCETERRGE